MRIRLSDHFTYGRLLRYTFPSMIMMVFTSIYNIVDGLFVSNYVGKEAFAAVNLVYPIFMIISAIGFMLGSGGTAIIGQTLGEGQQERACQYFSMLVRTTFILGVIATVLVEIFMVPLAHLLGARDHLLAYCVRYGRVCTLSMPFFMLQTSFQTYFNVAEKPKLGLTVTVLSGCANIILDYLLVGVLGWGLVGAAVATNISEITGGLVPVIYFSRRNSSLLRFCRAPFVWNVFLKSCTNGSSEMLSNISSSVVSILYNYQLLAFAGSDGVAAYGSIMYVSFIFAAVQLGYSSGSAPIVSFHYGAENTPELRNLFRKSLVIIGAVGVSMFTLAQIFCPAVTWIFVGYDADLHHMTQQGFRIYAFSFLIFGYTIYGSSFFTALGDGKVSAVLSFFRTLVFQVGAVLLLPRIFGLTGIWSATVVAESLALVLTISFWVKKRRVYGYA